MFGYFTLLYMKGLKKEPNKYWRTSVKWSFYTKYYGKATMPKLQKKKYSRQQIPPLSSLQIELQS